MDRNKYIKIIIKKLKCSRKKKIEITRELESDIMMAMESGEDWQQIKERMGSPSTLALEFNQNLSETELKSYKRTKRMKIILLILILFGLIMAGINFMLPKAYEIKEDSTFDQDKVISQGEMVITLLNNNDYETIKNQYADAKMKEILAGTTLADAKEQINADWGKFESITSVYIVEMKQMGKKYAVAQITALYENLSVTFTITFDEEMKLAGLYMK